MRSLRLSFAALAVAVVTLSPAAFLTGCGDETGTTGTQVKETEAAKKERQKTEDAMREAMAKKAAPKKAAK